MDLKGRLTSRKFWASAVAVLSALVLVINAILAGDWELAFDAIDKLLIAVGIYVGVEGAIDASRAFGEGKGVITAPGGADVVKDEDDTDFTTIRTGREPSDQPKDDDEPVER